MSLYLQEVKMDKTEDKKNPSGNKSVESSESSSIDEKMEKSSKDSSESSVSAAIGKQEETAPSSSSLQELAKEKKTLSSSTVAQVSVKKEEVKLSGLYAFKLAMSSVYDEKGRFVPVTFLKMKPLVVSQVKKKEKEGYNSVQVACMPRKTSRSSKALKGHLSSAGFAESARYIREIRQDVVDNIKEGQSVSIHSIQKGDKVKVQSVSKGHGFAGVVKRWGFKGGPASHGAKTHRTSGSIGNRTEPARVMPGKKMAGHYGVEKVSLRSVQVMDVIPDENLIVVKGPVPGARNSLVFLLRAD